MAATRLKALIREPLLHFLLLGAALFFVYDFFLNPEFGSADPQTIIVGRANLLTFLQFRSRAFDSTRFQDVMERLSKEELQQLIRDYVREEALYREAKALQLDKNDYVSRLRLIQQLEFITRGFADTQVQVTEQEIQRYYESHKSDYRVEPNVTFTHVFFSSDRRGALRAEELARAELQKLNAGHVRFDQAPAHGERFLYQVNYVEREADEVASHFGADMQAKLFALEPNGSLWRGPFQSAYGAHLVLLIQHRSGYLPSLEEVRARLEPEVRQATSDARFEASVKTIVDSYAVKVHRDEFVVLRGGQNRGSEDQNASLEAVQGPSGIAAAKSGPRQ